jgi:hypothetical protein
MHTFLSAHSYLHPLVTPFVSPLNLYQPYITLLRSACALPSSLAQVLSRHNYIQVNIQPHAPKQWGRGFKFLNSERFKVHGGKKRTSDKKIPPTNVAVEHTQHIHNEASYILQCDNALLGKQLLMFEGL